MPPIGGAMSEGLEERYKLLWDEVCRLAALHEHERQERKRKALIVRQACLLLLALLDEEAGLPRTVPAKRH